MKTDAVGRSWNMSSNSVRANTVTVDVGDIGILGESVPSISPFEVIEFFTDLNSEKDNNRRSGEMAHTCPVSRTPAHTQTQAHTRTRTNTRTTHSHNPNRNMQFKQNKPCLL